MEEIVLMSICEAKGSTRFFSLPTGWPCLLFLFKKLKKLPRDGTKYTKMENGKKVPALVFQSRLALCDPGECGSPGSSVHGILQAKSLGWGACPSPWDLPDPGIEPWSPALQTGSFLLSHQREWQRKHKLKMNPERSTSEY